MDLEPNRTSHPLRHRKSLVVAALALAGALAVDGLAAGHEAPDVDAPSGFGATPLAAPAAFTDDVNAKFKVKYATGGTTVANVASDASNVLMARVTWQPGGTSGWHTHPGPVIVTVAEGALEVTNASDCITRTYAAGEAFLDTGQGNVHVARNASDSEGAVAYATFLDVPSGQPATAWAEPADC